jgi:hypothetical protein
LVLEEVEPLLGPAPLELKVEILFLVLLLPQAVVMVILALAEGVREVLVALQVALQPQDREILVVLLHLVAMVVAVEVEQVRLELHQLQLYPPVALEVLDWFLLLLVAQSNMLEEAVVADTHHYH